ncbi:hypothetical protein LR48_Vigan01g321400 [Vigna angularis]|uniref:Uncharacterized protein n=1 Tax=Phaseolus angularis TaxID=3914 RepID=A0A0L9TST2_PHAAN|nr:hypothetical protein LR48_Vigan01g321400 [Vigna angularis]
MRGTQGALIVASILQIVVGFSGLWRNVVSNLKKHQSYKKEQFYSKNQQKQEFANRLSNDVESIPKVYVSKFINSSERTASPLILLHVINQEVCERVVIKPEKMR